MKPELILFGAIILLQIAIIYLIVYEQPVNFALHEKTNHSITGVYFPEASYCVQVTGRNKEEIQTTDYHEACHALIDMDYKHFCER